jgi:hypothetical protein
MVTENAAAAVNVKPPDTAFTMEGVSALDVDEIENVTGEATTANVPDADRRPESVDASTPDVSVIGDGVADGVTGEYARAIERVTEAEVESASDSSVASEHVAGTQSMATPDRVATVETVAATATLDIGVTAEAVAEAVVEAAIDTGVSDKTVATAFAGATLDTVESELESLTAFASGSGSGEESSGFEGM